MKFEWQLLKASDDSLSCAYRAKVFGGWIVNSYTCIRDSNPCESMVFVPDPNHEWNIENARELG